MTPDDQKKTSFVPKNVTSVVALLLKPEPTREGVLARFFD